ncbi:MAG TPA: hypothetical protein VK524_28075 [Polyangiaceae bacterium]|nr:hypothetical protein [Polyangiaceae bacterium]
MGCNSGESGEAELRSQESELMGSVINTCADGGACNSTESARITQLGGITRATVRSAAFAECMNRSMRFGVPETQSLVQSANAVSGDSCYFDPAYSYDGYGPYISCRPSWNTTQQGSDEGGENNDDAVWNELVDRQIARALNALHSDVSIKNRFDIEAGAWQAGYDPAGPASNVHFGPFSWHDTNGNGVDIMEALVGTASDGGWFSTTTHETLHNWGYDHGCYPDGSTAHGNCDRDPNKWEPHNALNAIAAFCTKEVIYRSTNAANSGCGLQGTAGSQLLKTCPDEGAYMMVSRFALTPTTNVPCHCVPDSYPYAQNAAADDFGRTLAVGDFNADTFEDLAVGAPNKSGGGTVFIYRGSKLGLRHWRSFSSADLSLGSTSTSARCGTALAAGDFNGDAVDDLAVGCPGWSSNKGRVAVLSGCSTGCTGGRDGLQSATRQLLGTSTTAEEFGYALAAGPLRGSTTTDELAVGAPAAAGKGRVDLFENGSNLALAFSRPGLVTGERFGEALAFGNVYSTANKELLIGAPQSGGKGLVYYVPSTGASTFAVSVPTLPAGAQFGKHIAAGQLFGSALDDIIIAAPGTLFLYRADGADSAPATAAVALSLAFWPNTEFKAISFVPGSPYGQLLTGHPGINDVLRLTSDGTNLLITEAVGQANGIPFWSSPASQVGDGYCQKLDDINSDVHCPIDNKTFGAASVGSAVAYGSFGNGLQYVLGAPTDNVGIQPIVNAGSVYVRGGSPMLYLADGNYVEPLEYRLDQVSVFYSGVRDARILDTTPDKWSDDFCKAGETCMTADIDADGKADLVAFSKNAAGRVSDVWVARSNGASGFSTPEKWHDNFCQGSEFCAVGDVDGDNDDDLIAFTQSATPGHFSHVHVLRAKNGAVEEWHSGFCNAGEACRVGDTDADGRDDIVAFSSNGWVWVAKSTTASAFGAPQFWHNNFCPSTSECALADVNADGKADAIAFQKGASALVYVAPSTGSRFGTPADSKERWHDNFCGGSGASAEECRVADMNGDGNVDIVAFVRDANAAVGDVKVALSNRHDFGPAQVWQSDFCRNSQVCRLGDVNNDRRSDGVTFMLSTPGKDSDVEVAVSQK